MLENTLERPWTIKKSNLSVLKEISPEHSLEGLMLKLQHFGHLMRRTHFLEKTLMFSNSEGRRRGQQRIQMVGWPHGLNVYKSEQIRGDGGEGSLAVL